MFKLGTCIIAIFLVLSLTEARPQLPLLIPVPLPVPIPYQLKISSGGVTKTQDIGSILEGPVERLAELLGAASGWSNSTLGMGLPDILDGIFGGSKPSNATA